MTSILTGIRHLVGLEDVDQADPFRQNHVTNRVRVRVAVGAATVAGLLIVILAIVSSTLSSVGKQVEIPIDLTATPGITEVQDTRSLGEVLIHVVGEVNRPGIYELQDGSRVIDAVMAAGGLRTDASECGVNLARELKDGEQISIPSHQQGCSANSGETVGSTLSLNQSTAEQFDSLPGIGPTLAERIVQWRESNNGFSSVDQLNEVSGIGDKLFAGIKDLVSL